MILGWIGGCLVVAGGVTLYAGSSEPSELSGRRRMAVVWLLVTGVLLIGVSLDSPVAYSVALVLSAVVAAAFIGAGHVPPGDG